MLSFSLGYIKYKDTYNRSGKSWAWQQKFLELWNSFVNFAVPGLIGYYFVVVKWPLLLGGQDLNTADIILMFVLILGLFGHLSVMSYNITVGVETILRRVLDGPTHRG